MINFTLSIDQANLIMKHLGNGSYVEVSDLVAELQRQAAPQLAPPAPAPVAAPAPESPPMEIPD